MIKLRNLVIVLSVFVLGLLSRNLIPYILAHGGDTNLIHGCIRPLTGLLRIVGANDNCAANETPLDWQKETKPGTSFPFISHGEYFGSFGNRLAGMDFSHALIDHSDFMGNDLTGINFSYGLTFDVNFVNVNLTNSNLSNMESLGASFIDSNLTNANLSNTILLAGFTNSTLLGANFSGADTSATSWDNTICPDGTNSDGNGNTCEGHLTP